MCMKPGSGEVLFQSRVKPCILFEEYYAALTEIGKMALAPDQAHLACGLRYFQMWPISVAVGSLTCS